MTIFTKIVNSVWYISFWLAYSIFFLVIGGEPSWFWVFLTAFWGTVFAMRVATGIWVWYDDRQYNKELDEYRELIRQAASDIEWDRNWTPTANEISNMKENKV